MLPLVQEVFKANRVVIPILAQCKLLVVDEEGLVQEEVVVERNIKVLQWVLVVVLNKMTITVGQVMVIPVEDLYIVVRIPQVEVEVQVLEEEFLAQELVGLSQHLEVVSPTQVEAEAELGVAEALWPVALVVEVQPMRLALQVMAEAVVGLSHTRLLLGMEVQES